MRFSFHLKILFLSIFFAGKLSAQNFFESSDTLNQQRRNTVVYSTAALGTVTLVGLNEMWYKNYPRSSFHFINDNSNWLQMDKFGHALNAYYIGSLGMKSFRWAGIDEKKTVWIGGSMGLIFLTTVEVLDGFSEQWGASMGDVVANMSGAALLIGQELLWNEQRVEMKFSHHPTKYAAQNPAQLGSNAVESIIKDYNGQTFWFSLNPWSFAKDSSFPKWLSVSLGYGGGGMLKPSESLTGDDRYRKYLLSLDLKLSNIDTRSKFWNSFFDVINIIKVPFPALEYNSNGDLKFHYLYF